MQQDECIDKPTTEQILRSTCQPHDFPSSEIYKKNISNITESYERAPTPPPLPEESLIPVDQIVIMAPDMSHKIKT